MALDTPKASGGVYLGHTTEKANGDLESAFGIEALGSIMDIGVQESKADTGGMGVSLGVGAGGKAKVLVRADEVGVKSVTVDLEAKFMLGASFKFTVSNPFREQPEKRAQ